MATILPLGFNPAPVTIPMNRLVPHKPILPRHLNGAKFASIKTSIADVGVIEMPLVYPLGQDRYEILDGHLRIEALTQLGRTEVVCLVATDDETYSIVDCVNQLMPIQEHYMIMTALRHGVSEERLAQVLQVDVKNIQLKRNLLSGICPEAVNLLENTTVGSATLQQLKRVKPERQVEITEMMLAANNLRSIFCRGLILATKPHLLTEEYSTMKKKQEESVNYTELARMQEELESLQRGLQVYEDSYGQNFLNLVVVRGYLAKLLGNVAISRFLETHYSDIHSAFKQIVDSASLEG
jgi:hypothetical protein